MRGTKELYAFLLFFFKQQTIKPEKTEEEFEEELQLALALSQSEQEEKEKKRNATQTKNSNKLSNEKKNDENKSLFPTKIAVLFFRLPFII
jgi:hypothetical protein